MNILIGIGIGVLFIVLMIKLISQVRIRESTILKAINHALKVLEFSQEEFEQLKISVAKTCNCPSVVVFDVTGDETFMRGLSKVVNVSTPENVKENVTNYIAENTNK